MRWCLLVSIVLSAPLAAAPIADFALGSQLAGAPVTVTRFGGVMSSAFFAPSGTGAIASSPGSAGFTLTVSPGDTSLATWTLTNTDPSIIFLNVIVAVSIDLTFSGISVFDDGSTPSTPDSGPGILGVTYLSGVTIGSATELLPWGDPANLGDIYRALTITFGPGFTTGASSSWSDDTDVITDVPEPGSLVLTACGVCLGLVWRRRRAVLLDTLANWPCPTLHSSVKPCPPAKA
ncbi:MAG: PEP-CTERM sorting domain-containing protein [Bryobacteraceae bacterium]